MTAITVARDTGHMEDLLLGNESCKPGLRVRMKKKPQMRAGMITMNLLRGKSRARSALGAHSGLNSR